MLKTYKCDDSATTSGFNWLSDDCDTSSYGNYPVWFLDDPTEFPVKPDTKCIRRQKEIARANAELSKTQKRTHPDPHRERFGIGVSRRQRPRWEIGYSRG